MSGARSEGACRCGEARFAVTGRPLVTMACHCRGCQQMTGSAFSLGSLYPSDRFEALAGETVMGGLKGGARHHMCPSCMSWLYTRPEGFDGFVNIRSSLLDDAAAHRPFADVNLAEGFDWAHSGAVEKFETAPAEAEFGGLMERYAAWDGANAPAPPERIES